MKTNTVLPIIGLLVLVVFVLAYTDKRLAGQVTPSTVSSPNPSTLVAPCKPTFADGGGPYYLPNQLFRAVLHPLVHQGVPLKVTGRVLRNDCVTPAADVIVDIWHADETGEYVDEWYRGQITTDDTGRYIFETVVPKGYGEGTGYRPPHIHFKIWQQGQLVITSQMFFPDVTGRVGFDDDYIMKVETKEEGGETVTYATHDIILPN